MTAAVRGDAGAAKWHMPVLDSLHGLLLVVATHRVRTRCGKELHGGFHVSELDGTPVPDRCVMCFGVVE